MFRIPCFGDCLGRRSNKRYKDNDGHQPRLRPKVVSIDDNPKAYQTWQTDSIMTNKILLSNHIATRPQPMGYCEPVEDIRCKEYPNMNEGVYLDHSGTTVYAQSLVMDFSQAMITNLWGNPHSENLPAKLSGNMVDDIRERALHFFGADPKHFDLVFVANATAGVKLVAEAFRDLSEKTPKGRFWYGYHSEVHNSVLGIRQLCDGQYHCFVNDEEVDDWLVSPKREPSHNSTISELGLFAYPGQSNLSGRRLPKTWPGRIREQPAFRNTYTLFDAAALAMTSPLDSLFADPATAPDFTCLSLYKVFGFPDLGALIVRRASGHILSLRKYFGGGTIAQVFPLNGDSRSVKKAPGLGSEDWSIHDGVEDGTLPFHSILALGLAIDTHTRLYGSMAAISSHCTKLATILWEGLQKLRYPDGSRAVEIYADSDTGFGDSSIQGAVFAFNVLRKDGSYVSWMDVEKTANEAGVFIRAGGVCCPGGVMKALQYEEWEWSRMFSSGHACGFGETAIVNRRPTGIVRASIGAMTTNRDIEALLLFLFEAYVQPESRRITSLAAESTGI